MSVSIELLNTTKAELSGPMLNTFDRNVPTRAALLKKDKFVSEGGIYMERPIMTGSPAKGVGLYNGDEPSDMTRYKRSLKFQVEPHRIFLTITIPKRELARNRGKNGAISLIKAYPMAVISAIASDMEKYLLTGKTLGLAFDSAEFYGFSTLNGQFASGLNLGTTNGLLDFATPASQTDVVQAVAKSLANFNYNQYGASAGWLTDGNRVTRKTYRKCAQFASKPDSGPDIVIMDDDSYANWTEDKLDLTRLVKVSDNPDTTMLQDVLGRGRVYPSDFIDLAADFTGAAANGVIYMVNTDFVEVGTWEKQSLGDFKEVIGNQDVVVAPFTYDGVSVFFNKFPAHGCVTGTAVA